MDQQKTKPSKTKQYTRKAGQLFVTALFFVVAGGLVWQGSNLIADRANAVTPPTPTKAILVSTAELKMQDYYTVSRAFAGQIEAPQTVTIAFETSGTVDKVHFDEGERVNAGDVLAVLDERLLQAELKKLKASKRAMDAQRELAMLTNKRQTELREKGFASNQLADQSRLKVVETDALLAEMDAAILAAEIRLDKATVRAPFSGRVDRRMIDPGTAIAGGQAILELVEDDIPVFRVGVDPDLVTSLEVGDHVEVDFGPRIKDAEIIAILPKIDPITRTRVVRAVLRAPSDLVFGQTGKLLIKERVQQTGAWVPLEAIEDGVRGLWTIKTVTDEPEPKVGIEAVEILHAEQNRVFVQGTFASGTQFILSGLHRVAPNQHVRIAD